MTFESYDLMVTLYSLDCAVSIESRLILDIFGKNLLSTSEIYTYAFETDIFGL